MQELSDYDIFIFRKFVEEELKKFIRPMRDFWAHAASYAEREPGEHALLDSQFASSVGYRVKGRAGSKGPTSGVAVYPFVKVRALKVIPMDGRSRQVLCRALDDPIRIEELYCVLDGGSRIAFLSREAYAATCSGNKIESAVILGREEAYAILAGHTLERTKRKLVRVFEMEEGEWLDKLKF